MKLSNFLYLLASITIARAQDDNPSGHELQGHNHYDSLIMTTGTSSLDDSLTITSSLDDSSTTSSLDDSAFRVSSVNKNVFEYSILLWGFLIL